MFDYGGKFDCLPTQVVLPEWLGCVPEAAYVKKSTTTKMLSPFITWLFQHTLKRSQIWGYTEYILVARTTPSPMHAAVFVFEGGLDHGFSSVFAELHVVHYFIVH